MCIYLGDDVDLTVKSEDHIFPACVGGTMKLSNQAVCAEANKRFSALENVFSHESMISMLREFYGPGKRGKSKVPKGVIRTIYNEQDHQYNLGYLFEGKPILIPQIIIGKDKKSFNFVCDPELVSEPQLVFDKLIQKLYKKLTEDDKFTYVEIDGDSNSEELIVGWHIDKVFIATSNPRECIDLDLVSKLLNVCMSANVSLPKRKIIAKPVVHGQIIETEKANRIYAKTVFNSLCYLKGIDFVKHPNFDSFREWIITGDGHSDDWINEDIAKTPDFVKILPEYSHWCFFLTIQNKVVATVSFYGYSTRKFVIGELPHNSSFSLLGLICDWKKKKEITLDEFIFNYAKDNRLVHTKE